MVNCRNQLLCLKKKEKKTRQENPFFFFVYGVSKVSTNYEQNPFLFMIMTKKNTFQQYPMIIDAIRKKIRTKQIKMKHEKWQKKGWI